MRGFGGKLWRLQGGCSSALQAPLKMCVPCAQLRVGSKPEGIKRSRHGDRSGGYAAARTAQLHGGSRGSRGAPWAQVQTSGFSRPTCSLTCGAGIRGTMAAC